MALGDGIRRNVAKISQAERDRLRDAFLKLDMPPNVYPDGVTYWDKQEDIHKNAHEAGQDVHGGPAFLPWHRELCNRLEALLRKVDPQLSLHYWDWTTDPRATPDGVGGVVNLFTPQFMGSAQGDAGPPFQNFESTEKTDTAHGGDGIHDHIWRNVNGGNPGPPPIPPDQQIVTTGDNAANQDQYPQMRVALEQMAHNTAHGYIGGTIGGGINPAHFSFHDPFVFLLHSNTDRLLAMWQTSPGRAWRLDPNQVYGTDGNAPSITTDLQPWAGDVGTGVPPLPPWVPGSPDVQMKNSKDPSVVTPPLYDSTMGVQRLNGFFQGANGNLLEFWWDGNRWNWTDHGRPPNTQMASAPAIVGYVER